LERLVLRGARLGSGDTSGPSDLAIEDGRVVEVGAPGSLASGSREADLRGLRLLPGLVNAHDVLEASTLPATGRPPYGNFYEWLDDAASGAAPAEAMRLSLSDRLFLGGMRNLLAGVTAVANHNPDHRSLGRKDFPARVLRKYEFAHSPGLVPRLRQSYRTTDRRIPWLVRAAAGTDARAAAELDLLAAANVLRQNTVIVHGNALQEGDVPRLAAARAAVVWCPEVADRLFDGHHPPVRALLKGGVPLGLGSASPAEGGRDFLTAMGAAHASGLVDEAGLVDLATTGGSAVARLPRGGVEACAPADLLAISSLADLLAGARAAVRLVVVAGRPLYGDPGLMRALVPAPIELEVDGCGRALERDLARRFASLLGPAGKRRPPALWLERVML
jgi:cytosine/adenosine deaminase-related metal-dependent hydrolase